MTEDYAKILASLEARRDEIYGEMYRQIVVIAESEAENMLNIEVEIVKIKRKMAKTA